MTEPDRDPILTYLREHAGRYRVAALRQRLLESGYDPAAVDRAVQAVQAETPPALQDLVREKAWRVLQVNAWLVGAGVALAFAPGVSRDLDLKIVLTLIAILGGEILGGLVLTFPRQRRALGLALLAGALLTIALGILLVWLINHLWSMKPHRHF